MIDYRLFHFATAPRTGSTWFMKACAEVGLGVGFKATVHVPHFEGPSHLIRVSLVRHPCDWLRSYFVAIGHGKMGVSEVDVFADLEQKTFDNFVRHYLNRMPGQIGRMFAAYNGDSRMRLEDMPTAFLDLASSVGVPYPMQERCLALGPQNGSKKLPLWSPSLYERVLEAEKEVCDEYEYWN